MSTCYIERNISETLKDDMPIDAEALLDELNAVDEHERIEAKRGTEAGKAVMKTVVAFGNEPRLDGGYILFGVQRRDTDAGLATRS